MSASTSVRPPRLRPGDTVAIAAPASPAPKERLELGAALLRERYRVIADDALLAPAADPLDYLAGSDARRADELNRYLADSDVRAIFMARGGYGCSRILDQLDADALARDPKLLVGFSDATALLAWADAAGVAGVHGPVVTRLAEIEPADRQWLFDLLERPEPPGPIPAALRAIGRAASGAVAGVLLGGNLTLLTHLRGTRFAPRLGGSVLFIEDVDEHAYAIDRHLTSLHAAGALADVLGVAVGDFADCRGRADPIDIVAERLASFGMAGLAGLPVGHGPRNLALPYGAACRLDFDRLVLELLEPAVS